MSAWWWCLPAWAFFVALAVAFVCGGNRGRRKHETGIGPLHRLVPIEEATEIVGDGSGHVLPPFDPTVERMDEL